MGIIRMIDPGGHGYSLDYLDPFPLESLSRAKVFAASTTHLAMQDPSPDTPDVWDFSGDFLSWAPNGRPTAGLVTGLTSSDPDGVETSVEGVLINVGLLFASPTVENTVALWSALLAGDDFVFGGAGPERISGFAGDDVIFAGLGDNTVFGGAGDDYVLADGGRNVFGGEAGDDRLVGAQQADSLDGGAGIDMLDGGGGADRLAGGGDGDWLWGGAGDDVLQGNQGADVLYGGAGRDTLRGGQDGDWIYGEDGADWLSGDLGSDGLVGGAGADVFHFTAGDTVDWIYDFSAAEGDRVHLDAGTRFVVQQAENNVVVYVGSGASTGFVVLVDVQLSSLQGSWIFTS